MYNEFLQLVEHSPLVHEMNKKLELLSPKDPGKRFSSPQASSDLCKVGGRAPFLDVSTYESFERLRDAFRSEYGSLQP